MMKLSGKYDLLDLLHEGETMTYQARQLSSGRQVLVHLRPFAAVPARQSHDDIFGMLWSYLRATLPQGRSKVLDMGEYENGVYLVTETEPGFKSLDLWLQSQMAPFEDVTLIARSPDPPPGVTPPPDTTRTIRLQTPPAVLEKAPGETVIPPTVPGGIGQAFPQEQGGKKVMQESASPGVEATQISPALTEALTQARDAWLAQKRPSVGPVPANAESSGESTMIFRPPEPSSAGGPFETSRPPFPATVGAAETSLLPGAGLLSKPAVEPVKPPLGLGSPVPGPTGSGEFTRLFQTPAMSSQAESTPDFGKPEPPFSAPTSSGEFTRIFQAPSPRQQMALTPPSAEAPSAPGEFTRVFGTALQSVLGNEGNKSNQPPGLSAQPGSAPASREAPGGVRASLGLQPGTSPKLPRAAPEGGRSFLPWVIVICVSIAALGLFLYFFLKR